MAARRLEDESIAEIFRRFAAAEPAPTTELNHVNHFTLLVAVALSAKSTDKGVNRATQPLFAIADTPEKMLALGEEQLKDYIKTVGFYRGKARNIMGLCRALIERHGGKVPRSREELEALPGVGRKTANVILNTAFDQPTIAVDTHVFRVSNRTGLAPGKTPLAVELALEQVVPARYAGHAHHWLLLHGRYVCKAPKPLCPQCLIRDICLFTPKTVAIA